MDAVVSAGDQISNLIIFPIVGTVRGNGGILIAGRCWLSGSQNREQGRKLNHEDIP